MQSIIMDGRQPEFYNEIEVCFEALEQKWGNVYIYLLLKNLIIYIRFLCIFINISCIYFAAFLELDICYILNLWHL